MMMFRTETVRHDCILNPPTLCADAGRELVAVQSLLGFTREEKRCERRKWTTGEALPPLSQHFLPELTRWSWCSQELPVVLAGSSSYRCHRRSTDVLFTPLVVLPCSMKRKLSNDMQEEVW